MHFNVKEEWAFDQAEVRLLLERGADPFAKHDHWRAFPTETRDPHDVSDSPFRSRPSIARLNDCPSRSIVKYGRKLVGPDGPYNDPFIASMKRGDKAVVKLMLDAIYRKEIPLVELKGTLDRARIEATENGNLHLLPILEDYYWAKRYPCK